MDKVLTDLKDCVLNDICDLMKGGIAPQDYEALGEAVDIIKDIHMIADYEMKDGQVENEVWEEARMSGVPARSPRTGRFMSRDSKPYIHQPYDISRGDWEAYGRTSYDDLDGSVHQDLQELLNNAKSDHERMLLMRVMDKIDR